MAIRVSSPLFVGRSAELDRIAQAVGRTAAGEGEFLLVSGEAGVGKTRLIDEAIERARHGGALAAVGHCVDLSGSSAPFAPVAQLLRDLRSQPGGTPPAGSEIGQRFTAIDDLADAPVTAERVGLAADSRQVRFFEAWLDLLEALGRSRPLLVVVEDIHWADRSTLDWLTYVARMRARSHFTVAVTIRADELHRRHPLQPFLAELQRVPDVTRLELMRFDRAEVAQQIGAIAGAPVDADLVDNIFARSNGNAFFSEELLAASGTDGPLPPALVDVALARVTELGSDTQELLRIAAVAGDEFSCVTLAQVMGNDLPEVERRLHEAVDWQVVVPLASTGVDAFAFRHALVREAVYSDLLPGERARLHGRFAAVIDELPDGRSDRSAELAYHWLAAYDLPRAFDASLDAARTAESMHGYAEAQRHYDRAIELWDRVPEAAARAGLDRAGLLEHAANAASKTDTDRAMALATMAIESVPVDAVPMRLALLKERFGRYAWLVGDGVTALEACAEAARLVEDEPPTPDRARVLASLGQVLMVTADMEAGGPVAAEAVRIARSVGASDIETHALTTLGVCTAYLGDLELGLEEIGAARRIAQENDAIDDVDRADSNLVDVLANSGAFRDAADVAIAASRFADEHGLGRVMGTWQLAEGGLALYRLGAWGGSRDLLERALLDRPTGALLMAAEQRLALIDVGQGRFDDAINRIARVGPLIGRVVEPQLLTPLTEARVELALWQNRPSAARDALAEIFGRVPFDRVTTVSRIGPVLALAARTEADVGTLGRTLGDTAGTDEAQVAAEAHAGAMRRLRDEARRDRPNFVSQADAWSALCEAELARLRGDADPPVWRAAASSFEAVPMAYPRAYALWRAGEVGLAAGGTRSEAAVSLREAQALASELGAVPLLTQIRAIATRGHLDLEVDRAPSPTATVGHDDLGLTRREREVLQLIADGRSNRQIAEHLFITEGTAGTHVSNILGKLGARGRTEAAAIAHRLSLVE